MSIDSTFDGGASGAQLRDRRHPLDALMAPRSVAVIGATEKVGSIGRALLWNLISNPFGGAVYPVNPRRPNVLGIRSYPDVRSVPEPVDLAVICTPALVVPDLVGECARAGVKAAVIVSAGFRETGPAGLALEARIAEQARAEGIRIIGPNCLGVMSPVSGLNATFTGTMARTGSVGFISESGALCSAVLDWSHKMNVGFSHFVSVGGMVDVGWGDLIDYMGDDARTKSIVIYMESIGSNAAAFLSAAREVALTKPIIVLKAGRSPAAARAAESHTGRLVGSDEALDAAFRRCGVLRVNSIAELFYMAEVLGKQPRPRGPRLAIVTNAGGPGILATDALLANNGELASLSTTTLAELDRFLPPHWSHGNPIDLLGDADAERFARALEVVAADPNADGLLVVLAPQTGSDPTQTADLLRQRLARLDKPLLASWMGGVDVAAGDAMLNKAGIPTFPFPDTAARVFALMWRYSYVLRGLYETPALPTGHDAEQATRERARTLIEEVRRTGRTLLSEVESKEVLGAYGIPVVQTLVATTEDEAVGHAVRLGFPVVVKLWSDVVSHKTEVGGVELNLQDESDVRTAWRRIRDGVVGALGESHFQGVTVQPMVGMDGYELIVGSTLDPQLGPVVLFGSGGQLVEVVRDRALALPPLNTTLARRMMEQTRISRAFSGVRGRKPIDESALEALLVRFSQLVIEQRGIAEIDINPVLASADGAVVLDARMILHGPEVDESQLPKLPIRPYPTQYAQEARLKDGTAITVRPIRPEDEPLMVRFHEHLSDRSVYFRYFHMLKLNQRVAHERLTRICFLDYDREMALVAEAVDATTGERQILGVGRLTKLRGGREAEFAVVIRDECQGRGLGSLLLGRLKDLARAEGISRVSADVLSENGDMIRLCQHLGFDVRASDEDPTVMRVVLTL